eukprot:5548510-Amphidinium_carterae.1
MQISPSPQSRDFDLHIEEVPSSAGGQGWKHACNPPNTCGRSLFPFPHTIANNLGTALREYIAFCND